MTRRSSADNATKGEKPTDKTDEQNATAGSLATAPGTFRLAKDPRRAFTADQISRRFFSCPTTEPSLPQAGEDNHVKHWRTRRPKREKASASSPLKTSWPSSEPYRTATAPAGRGRAPGTVRMKRSMSASVFSNSNVGSCVFAIARWSRPMWWSASNSTVRMASSTPFPGCGVGTMV